jgi:hypothetical protein
MSRQTAQRRIDLQMAMPIPQECAKHGEIGNAISINKACNEWLRKRGLLNDGFNQPQFGKGKKGKR